MDKASGETTPVISVIIATYNSAATLARTLDSLRAQTGCEFELLVIDGQSGDATMEIVAQYGDVISFSLSEPDGGVYHAWNKAIPRASGEWLMFLGSDDWLDDPHTLQRLSDHIAAMPPEHRRCSYVFGITPLIENGQRIELLGAGPLPHNKLGCDQDVPFSHTGLLHHRTLFDNFGLFDADFRSAGDFEFIHRSNLDIQVRFHHVPMVVAHMAAGGMSTGPENRLRHYQEMIEARQKLGLTNTPEWLKFALFRAKVVKFLHHHCGPAATLRIANAYRLLRGKAPRAALS